MTMCTTYAWRAIIKIKDFPILRNTCLAMFIKDVIIVVRKRLLFGSSDFTTLSLLKHTFVKNDN